MKSIRIACDLDIFLHTEYSSLKTYAVWFYGEPVTGKLHLTNIIFFVQFTIVQSGSVAERSKALV